MKKTPIKYIATQKLKDKVQKIKHDLLEEHMKDFEVIKKLKQSRF